MGEVHEWEFIPGWLSAQSGAHPDITSAQVGARPDNLPVGGLDHVRRLLRDHDHRGVGVAGRDAGHDGGVHDAQTLDAVYAQLRNGAQLDSSNLITLLG